MPNTLHESPQILVIGLDCASPELVFDSWRDDLPVLSRLMAHGTYARMDSCIPAITVPAWTCMMTSRDPGQLGIYGFRNRADHSYDRMTTVTARSVHTPRVWDLLGSAGKRVGIIGVPPTYPVAPVNGELVSCFLTPSARSAYTYPLELKREIERWIDDSELLMDVPDFRSPDKAATLRNIYRMAEQRFTICRRLLSSRRYDFFMLVDMGIDRIQHGFFRFMDPRHPGHLPGSPFATAIRDYYRFVDRQIGTLLDLVDEQAIVLVVSDHGGKVMHGGICLNEWLVEQGYLVLHSYPARATSLEQCDVDWARTRAWGSGGYYGRVFLNIQGREPQGLIPPAEAAGVRDEIAARLEAIPDHRGRPIATHAYVPDQIYHDTLQIPPDLLIYFGDLDWRAIGSVGQRSIYSFENDTGPDDANHAQHGLYILFDPRTSGKGSLGTVSIYDVAPTLLCLMREPVPAAMIGRPLC